MIKILVICSDMDGVGKYRLLDPHLTMNDPEIDIEIRFLVDGTLNLTYEPYTSQFNIIFYNKTLPFAKREFFDRFMEIVKKHNIKLIYDIDDYFILTSSHLNYKQWKDSGNKEVTEANLKLADAVITTTPIYQEFLKQYNDNVHVVENGFNSKEQQYQSQKRHLNDRTKFIWSGGISHMPDISLLRRSIENLDKDFLNKSQLFMCGYDLRMRTPQGVLKADPRSNEWTRFEDVFTNKGKWIDNDYRIFLNKYDDTDYGYSDEFKDVFYQRVWTKPISVFAENLGLYSNSVSLAPLKSNSTFNLYKSQLKVVEAGAHGTPIILSKYGPYLLDDIEKNGFGFEIREDDPMGWYEKMKWFVDNSGEIKVMGDRLKEYVYDNYEIQILNKKRAQIYKDVVNM